MVDYFEKDGTRTKYKPKTFTDWGHRGNNGLSYRKYDDHFYTMLTDGKIMVYSNNTFSRRRRR